MSSLFTFKKSLKIWWITFLKLWKLLSTLKVNKKILRDPFNFWIYIKKDKVFKDSLGISKSKFFPLITNKKYKNRVKRLFVKKSKDKISVLMTVCNCEVYIKDSIRSILSQTYSNLELIIIDDKSNDNTVQNVKDIIDSRIKLFTLEKKLGRTKALNFGLKKCSSNFIAIQDADDISENLRLEKQINELQKNDDLGLVGADATYIDEQGVEIF